MAILPNQNRPNNQAGSGFTNLQRVLQANKSNKLGSTVATGVQQAGQGARSAVNQAGQQFQTQLGAEKQRLSGVGQKASDILGNVTGATEDDVSTFHNILGGEYRGPTGIADANELRAKANEAESLGRAGGSEAGRFGLLQRFVGRGDNAYNLGSQRLDNLLLGQQGSQLKGARAGTMGLVGNTERKIGSAEAQGQEGRGIARKEGEAAQGKLSNTIMDYDTAMANQLAAKQAETDALIKSLGGTGSNKAIELDEKTLQNLKEATGGQLGEGQSLYRADISPYLKANTLYANKQAVQTAEDYAKAKKLAELSGNFLGGQAAGNTLQEYAMRPELVGQYDAQNKIDVTDTPALMKAIAASRGEMEAAQAAQRQGIDQLQRELSASTGAGSSTSSDYSRLFQQYAQKAPEMTAQKYLQQASSGGQSDPVKLDAAQKLADPNLRAQMSQADVTNLTKILDPNYLPNDITAAREWSAANDISAMADLNPLARQIEIYKNTANKELPNEFNILRTLKAKPSTV